MQIHFILGWEIKKFFKFIETTAVVTRNRCNERKENASRLLLLLSNPRTQPSELVVVMSLEAHSRCIWWNKFWFLPLADPASSPYSHRLLVRFSHLRTKDAEKMSSRSSLRPMWTEFSVKWMRLGIVRMFPLHQTFFCNSNLSWEAENDC